MTSFILGLIEITLTMSAVIVLLLILSGIFGKLFSAKCRYIVWTLIILRLCIPMNLSVLPPLYTYELPSEDFYAEEEIKIADTPTIPDNTPVTSAPTVDTPVTNTPSVPTVPNTPEIPDTLITEPEPTVPTPSLSVADMLFVLGIVWAAVAVLYLTFRLSVHGIYVASLSKSKTFPSPALSAFYCRVCEKAEIKNAPKLYVSASVTSPMLVGYFRPSIILPDIEFGSIELEGILSHELTHYRRGDLWIKLLSLIATSLHWFNPFVHIAAGRLNQETELSCDERVLAGCDDEARRIYGEAVLSVIRRNCHRSIALTTHFNPKKNAVKERFKAILDSTKKRRGRVIIAAALVLCAFAGAILGCSFGKDNSERSELPENFNELYDKAEDIYAIFTGYGGGDPFEYTDERITYSGYGYEAVSINGITTLEGLRELCKKYFSDEFTEALLSKETAASVPVYIEQDGKLYRFGGYVAPSAPTFPNGKTATLEKIENGVYTVRIDAVGVENGREIPITAYCSYTYKDDEIRFNSFEYMVEVFMIKLARQDYTPHAQVLENKAKIYDSSKKKEVLLSEWQNLRGLYFKKYTVVDLDADGAPETVLTAGFGTNSDYGFLVLHNDSDITYAHLFAYREFYDIKADGTFSFSGGVSNHGTGKISFEKDSYTINRIAYCESNDNNNISYFIDDKSVSKDEFDTYTAAQNKKDVLQWYDITHQSSSELETYTFQINAGESISLRMPAIWNDYYAENNTAMFHEEDKLDIISPDTAIKRAVVIRSDKGHEEAKKEFEQVDSCYKEGTTDKGYRYLCVHYDLGYGQRYVFYVLTERHLYYLEIWGWAQYDGESFFNNVAIHVANSINVEYEEDTITDIADWDKLPWIEESHQDRKRASYSYDFIYDLVSGKSSVPEYNELGIKDYSITLLANTSSGSSMIGFTFTVTGNSLPETLPPGTHTKILHEAYTLNVYDEKMPDNIKEYNKRYGLDEFGDIRAVEAVHTFLDFEPFNWEHHAYGKWGLESDTYPYSYICAFYGNGMKLGFDDFQKLIKEKFGIEAKRPTEDNNWLNRCAYDKETDTIHYADTRDFRAAHRFIDVKTTDGTAYVTVQLYADYHYLIPSHKLTYKIGEGEVFIGCERIETGKYEPNSLR